MWSVNLWIKYCVSLQVSTFNTEHKTKFEETTRKRSLFFPSMNIDRSEIWWSSLWASKRGAGGATCDVGCQMFCFWCLYSSRATSAATEGSWNVVGEEGEGSEVKGFIQVAWLSLTHLLLLLIFQQVKRCVCRLEVDLMCWTLVSLVLYDESLI